MLKSLTIIVWDAMCALSFSKVSFKNEGALVFDAQMFRIESSFLVDFSFDGSLYVFLMTFFIGYYNGYSSLFLGTICLEICFLIYYSEIVTVFDTEMRLLYAAKCWVCLCIHSVSLCLFIRELSPFLLRDIKEY